MLQTLQAPSSQWTFDECAGRRPAIEAVAARPRRGAGANEGLKPRLSRCVAFAALPGAVRRPPGAARPRRGAARSSCAVASACCSGALCPLRRRAAGAAPAATGCWCSVPAPPPDGRRHSRPSLPARSGLTRATQIAQQPRRAATRHLGSLPETQAARGSCFYLPAGVRHLPRPI